MTETWQLQLLTIIDHKMPLPATVDYYPKSGKTGEAHPELIMQHLRMFADVLIMRNERQIKVANYF